MQAVTLPPMRTRASVVLAEEHESARLALYALLPRFSREAFTTGNVETEDNVRGILCHVTFATFSYACWISRVLGRLELAVEKEEKAAFLARVQSFTSAGEFDEGSRFAAARYYAALAEIAPDDFDRDFKANWGPMFSIEAMLEHALVHLIRHRRQLEIHLGMRSAPVTREG
ncbi:MAG: hypothetical protein ACKVU1_10920 [bacterium]